MNPIFKTIGIYGKYQDAGAGDVVNELANFLLNRGHEVLIDEGTCMLIDTTPSAARCESNIGEHIELAVVVGGDGTMLNVARQLANVDVPILGINLGRLGFLTEIPANDIEHQLGRILDGEFAAEERFLLHSEIMRRGKIVHASNALNDVIIGKGELSRLIDFETFLDGYFVTRMRADGIIVATPTGSTAYALSAGGPILNPTLPALVLVPICPHTLSARPIVVSADSVVEIVVSGSAQQSAHVTFDGQANYTLQKNDRVYVRRAPTPVRLLHPVDRNHYDVLRAKLRWGEQLV
ncbi:MAG: NAD(+) kinase [Gammaproteobacteria bacterium]|jgi:NAD+ kinase|nr:NAD(+) kinase [Gammaproteobacteria bacterium]